MRHIIGFLLICSISLSPQANDSPDYLKGFAGLQYQIDNINRDIHVLQNATISQTELQRQLTDIENRVNRIHEELTELNDHPTPKTLSFEEIESLKKQLSILDFESVKQKLLNAVGPIQKQTEISAVMAARNYADKQDQFYINTAISLASVIIAFFAAVAAFISYDQKKQKDTAGKDKDEVTRDISSLRQKSESEIVQLRHKHEEDIQRLTYGHEQKIARLEQINLKKLQAAEDNFTELMAETGMHNGLIYKNLAVSIYQKRFLAKSNIGSFLDNPNMELFKKDKLSPGVLLEVVSIQEHAISRFNIVRDSLERAQMLYLESLLDLAYYLCEFTYFGFLNDEAKSKIRDLRNEFQQQQEAWLRQEMGGYVLPDASLELARRTLSVQDSLLFISVCLEEQQPLTAEEARKTAMSHTGKILKNITVTKTDIEDVAEKKRLEGVWNKYDEFAERPIQRHG